MGKKKKRKPSKYNKHVAREMKAGKTMAQAAASWNKKPAKKKSSKKKTSRSRKKSTRKQTSRRRKPRAQKVLFPTIRRILKDGPVRSKVRAILGGR